MAPLPLAKIVILGIKQISKPISIVIKSAAKHQYFFKKYICIPPGQLFHRLEVRSKMYLLNMQQPKIIPPLTEKMATEVGADVLGELIVLSIGLYLIYYEVSRQARKDKAKHDKHKQSKLELETAISSLTKQVVSQDEELETLRLKVSKYSDSGGACY